MTQDELIERVKEAATVYVAAEVCGVRLPRPGVKCKVPWRADKNPSATVLPDGRRIHDFSAGDGMDAVGMVQEMKGVGFPMAVNLLAEEMGLTLPFEEEYGRGRSRVLVESLGRWPGSVVEVAEVVPEVRGGIANFAGTMKDEAAHETIAAACRALAEDEKDQEAVAEWRGFSVSFVRALAVEGRLGAVRDEAGALSVMMPCAKNAAGLWVRAQLRKVGPRSAGCEWFWPAKSEHKPGPWVAAEGLAGGLLIVGEGWGDAAAARLLADEPEARIVATLGTGCRGLAEMSPAAEILLARQNETGDANAMWARRIQKSYGDKVIMRSVIPPKGVKDWNDALGKWGTVGGRELWAGAVKVEPDRFKLSVSDVPMNDDGSSRVFVHKFGADLRWVPEIKTWRLLQANGLWKNDRLGEVKEMAKSISNDLSQTWKGKDDKRPSEWIMKLGDRSRVLSMLDMAASVKGIAKSMDDWDSNGMLAGVLNGVLDLEHGQLLPDDAAEDALITKHLGCKFVPGARCPTWERFMDQVMIGDRELVEFIQMSLGYSLTGKTDQQVFWFLYGTGSNGKGAFIRLLEKLFGGYMRKASKSIMVKQVNLNPLASLAELPGVRMLFGTEVGEGDTLNEELVKEITGQDTVTAEAKYCAPFEFRPLCKLWITGNHKLIIRGMDHGIWRRVLAIPFLLQIGANETDSGIEKRMEAELSGILNWCLEGLRMLNERGGKLTELVPEKIKMAVAEYREDSDLLGDFVKDHLEPLIGFKVRKADVYSKYVKWCEEEGIKKPMSNKSLSRKLKDRGMTEDQNKMWVGYRLKTEGGAAPWDE
jgi:P4 family phage/plasmid primase-like protien